MILAKDVALSQECYIVYELVTIFRNLKKNSFEQRVASKVVEVMKF